MAVLGRVNTYGTVENTPDYVGNAMKIVEDNAFKYRAEERLKKEAEEKKKAEDEKELLENIAKFGDKSTGVYNIDNVSSKLAEDSKNAYADAERELQTATNPQKRMALKLKQQELLAQFDQVKQQKELFLAKRKEVEENIAKGIYNPDDEKQLGEWVKSLNDMSARVDERGIWKFSTYQTDESGKRTGVLTNDTDMAGLISQMDRFKKSQYDDFKTNFYKNNPLDRTKIQKGFNTETKELVTPEQKIQAENAGIAISKNPDELYQKWLEMTGERKRTWTDEEKAQVAKYVADDLVRGYKTIYEKDIDQAGALAAKKDKREQDEKKVVIGDAGFVKTEKTVIEGTKETSRKGEAVIPVSGAKRNLGEGRLQNLKDVRIDPTTKEITIVVEETFEGQTVKKEGYTKKGLAKVERNRKLPDDEKEELTTEDYEVISETSKKPKIQVFRGNKEKNDVDGFLMLLPNPNKKDATFDSYEEAQDYFYKKAGFDNQPKEEVKTKTYQGLDANGKPIYK